MSNLSLAGDSDGHAPVRSEGRRRLGTKSWSQENSYAADPVSGSSVVLRRPESLWLISTTLGKRLPRSTSSSTSKQRKNYSVRRAEIPA